MHRTATEGAPVLRIEHMFRPRPGQIMKSKFTQATYKLQPFRTDFRLPSALGNEHFIEYNTLRVATQFLNG